MRFTKMWGARLLAAAVALLALHGLATPAPQEGAAGQQGPRLRGNRFEFEVVESFDAQYLGDTPGHMGRYGGLGDRRPDVALGDPVYLGDIKVGTISRLIWDRSRGSLEVEFDPEPFQRISVGAIVWISLDGARPAQPAR